MMELKQNFMQSLWGFDINCTPVTPYDVLVCYFFQIDMVQIKQCFLEMTKQTLYNWIKDDTSGDYKKILLAIVGKDQMYEYTPSGLNRPQVWTVLTFSFCLLKGKNPLKNSYVQVLKY